MGYGSQHNYRAPACLGCGTPDAARIGNSEWGCYGTSLITACGDICGKRIATALQEAHASERYKFFLEMKQHAEDNMTQIERGAITDARVSAGGPEKLPDPFTFAAHAR